MRFSLSKRLADVIGQDAILSERLWLATYESWMWTQPGPQSGHLHLSYGIATNITSVGCKFAARHRQPPELIGAGETRSVRDLVSRSDELT